MRPVDMLCGKDCIRACVASIFELPAGQVPHFAMDPAAGDGTEAPWSRLLKAWLHDRGYAMLLAEIPDAATHWDGAGMPFHHIRIGPHPSGSQHAAVFFGSQLVHDPLPGPPAPFQAYPQHYLIFVKA